MSYHATVLHVMIASPSDVESERKIINDVIHNWNSIHSAEKKLILLPASSETHSAPIMGDRAQAIVNEQVLRDCDLLIGVFWTRIGTPTGESISGTVEEIDRHIELGKPAMIYFSSVPVHPDSIDPIQYQTLKTFKDECRSRGLVEKYDSIEGFKDKVFRQLSILVNTNPYLLNLIHGIGTSKSSDLRKVIVLDLSPESKRILFEAATDRRGKILRHRMMLGGVLIGTNEKTLGAPDDPRSGAALDAAIDQLSSMGLIRDDDGKGVVFKITQRGYKAADALISSSSGT